MKKIVIALVAASALTAPLAAQSAEDQRRWDYAQERYRTETARYQAERDRYYAISRADRSHYAPAPPPPGADPYATDYDASRYYRDDPRYRERVLTSNDQVYRGSDGRYYCKRSDGTTGLIIGAASGGILGNIIDGGRHRTAGTLIGGAIGALAGRSIDQDQVKCK